MQTVMDTDVLICGAGPTGLSLALVLARQGVDFLLLEKASLPFHGSRGKGLQPRTLEIFEDLGLLAPVLASGGPYPVQREYAADGSWRDSALIEAGESTPAEPYAVPWMLPQFLTEAAMRHRLQQMQQHVQFGCEVLAFEQDAQGVTATLSDQRRLRARYLVGADGGRSMVRQQLDVAFPGKTLGARAVVADLSLSGLSRDAWHRFGSGDMASQLALCPLAGTDLFQLQGPVPLDGGVDLTAAGLTRMIVQRSGRDDILVGAVHWASVYHMNARLAECYRRGRVFLAGDAAHVHPPTGGQGLNTSVQDAYNLGWKLAAALDGADPVLLDTYEQERRPIAASMLGMSTRLLAAAQQGEMRRGREVRQLDLEYRTSSLAVQRTRHQRRVAAGDRAPDALLHIGQEPVRLFELLRGAHWTLLGWEVPHLPAVSTVAAMAAKLHVHGFGVPGGLVDSGGHFARAYGLVRGDLLLIRPDGYIGAMLETGQHGTLDAYLARVGIAPMGLTG